MELQGRDVTTSTNPARGPRRKSGPAPKSLGCRRGDGGRPGDCGESPPRASGHSWICAVLERPAQPGGGHGGGAVAEVPNKFRRIRDRSDFPPPPKHGSGPPGLLSIVRGKHRMRHPVHALFRVTALAALLAFPARALAGSRPRSGRSGRPDHPDEPRRGHRLPGEEVRGRAQDPEAGAGPRVDGGAGQAPDQGPHAHPLRHRRDRRLQAARSRHQAVQEGDRDPERHRPHEGAGDA